MDTGIFPLMVWLFASPWASLVIAYAFYALALHLYGSARSPFEHGLIWGTPICWSLNMVWAFIAQGMYGPIRIDLFLSIPALILITLCGVLALIRASFASNTSGEP